jgi:hypothetical protein
MPKKTRLQYKNQFVKAVYGKTTLFWKPYETTEKLCKKNAWLVNFEVGGIYKHHSGLKCYEGTHIACSVGMFWVKHTVIH